MVVVGTSTAALAPTSWVPPFQPYTSTAPISYVGGPQSTSATVTGTGVTPTATAIGTATSGPAYPTIAAIADDREFLLTYLPTYALSYPSYRYAYFLWFVLIGLLILYSIFHHLNFQVGPLGALWAKYAVRRRIIKINQNPSSKLAGAGAGGGIPEKKAKTRKQRTFIWPSYAQVLSIGLMSATVALFCVIGADYLAAGSGVWDLGTSFSKRGMNALSKRADVVQVNYNIGKAWWTAGGRTGLIAIALFPLVILFVVKAPPFALFSLRIFTHLFNDKLVLMHKWAGRLIWFITTVHVVLWTIQLFISERGNGSTRSVWFYMWGFSRFRWACVAYAAMTGMVVTSTKWFRQKQFEFFYATHMVLTCVTLLASAMHYPGLGYWCAIAAFLWLGDRIYRFIRFSIRNKLFGGLSKEVSFTAGERYEEEEEAWRFSQRVEDEYNMKDINSRPASGYDFHKSLPKDPFNSGNSAYNQYGELGQRASSTLYDQGSFDTKNTAYEDGSSSYFAGHGGKRGSYGGRDSEAGTPLPYKEEFRNQDRNASVATGMTASSSRGRLGGKAVVIPPGYAHAQLLPSKVVRLTIRVPKPFTWYAGQHVSVYLPELSRWQSHPFSLLTAYSKEREGECVLLIKARKGITAKLWNETRKKVFAAAGIEVSKKVRQSLSSVLSVGNANPPPVLFRAMLDGPFGSAARGKPGMHESVVIVCGGTGVSFGMSCLDSLVRIIAAKDSWGTRPGEGRRKFITKRVRFVWVVREFTEIAWIASQLRRCMDMVPQHALQIDIFVTGASAATMKQDDSIENKLYDPHTGALEPPKPHFAGGGGSGLPRVSSSDSIASQMSGDGTEIAYLQGPSEARVDIDDYYGGNDDGIDDIDLTNYEDEELEPVTPITMRFSQQLRKEGKLRRAKTRKSMRLPAGRRGQADRPPVPPLPSQYPPAPQRQQTQLTPGPNGVYAYDNPFGYESGEPSRSATPLNDFPEAESPVDQSYTAYNAYEQPRPLLQGQNPRNSWTPSHTDSAYGQYDPFGDRHGRGMSPAPSVRTFEYDQRSYIDAGGSNTPRPPYESRNASMVLLESGTPAEPDSAVDAGLWMDKDDYESMLIMSEMARPGRPKIDVILGEEISRAEGTIGVGTCGPNSLNAMVRNAVSDCISIKKAMKGDKTGVIALFSEDYEA